MLASFLKLAIVFAAYFLTGKLGLSFEPVAGFATLVWPPTGIAVASTILYGFSIWPAIFFGAFFVNLTTGADPMVATGIALGNTLEALAAAYILKKFIGFKGSFEKLSESLGLILFVAIFSTTISASIGVLSLYLGKVISIDNIPFTWINWWTGDMLGALIFAPLIIVWAIPYKSNFSFKRLLELAFIFTLCIASGLLIFSSLFGVDPKYQTLSYIVFPPLIWLALKFGPRETITATFLISCIAIYGTIQNIGPFARINLQESLMRLQSFMGIVSSTLLIVSSLVTERNRLEEKKDEFIGLTAHEIRTPLATISGYHQILTEKLKVKKQTQLLKYLEAGHQQIDRLNSLVSDLLDLSKVRTSEFTILKEEVKVKDLLKTSLANIKTWQSKQQLILKIGFNGVVWADKNRIEQVINNLVSNAIKYSSQDKQILIKVKKEDEFAVISVQDSGLGIPENAQEKIFERFYRVEAAKNVSGLGLGLYLCSIIIRKHGGKIWFKSTPGKGTTFFFSLPIKS